MSIAINTTQIPQAMPPANEMSGSIAQKTDVSGKGLDFSSSLTFSEDKTGNAAESREAGAVSQIDDLLNQENDAKLKELIEKTLNYAAPPIPAEIAGNG